MGLKAAGADLAFKGGLMNGTRGIAAFSAAGTELSENAYARISRVLANWKNAAGGDGLVNDGVWNFPEPSPAAWSVIALWGMYSAATAGTLLLDYDSADTAAPQLGADVGFADGAIGWRFSGGRITAAGGLKCCNEGLVSGTRYLTLHTGATPSGDNFVDQPVLIAAARWTGSTVNNTPGSNSDGVKHRLLRNNAEVSFGAAISDLDPLMSVALRDGSNGANAAILWSSTFTTAPDDPDLGDTLSFAANALEIFVPID